MKTMNIGGQDIKMPAGDLDLEELKKRLNPLLKQASEICGTNISLVNLCGEVGCETLASYGREEADPGLISSANRISDIAGAGSGLMVVDNPAGHQKIASQLSKPEKERIRFYAGMPLRSQSGETIGYLCVCDSETLDLTESQKDHLQMLANGALNLLQLYQQTQELNGYQKKLERYSTLLDNSADVTFILDTERGRIENVNSGVEKILGYESSELNGTLFQDLIVSDKFSDSAAASWFESEQKTNGRYKAEINFLDSEDKNVCMECNFTMERGKWFVTASDISEQKEAEKRVSELKGKFKKVVDVATDLIYELDWQSGELSWGDELTSVLGYPDTERFVDYDWWLDKIHPEDLDHVIKDVAETVEGESKKMKLVYRIRTYEGSYKYVMNPNYVDRHDDGTPSNIIGAIVDISDLVKSHRKSDQNRQLLEKLAENAWSATWIRDNDGTFIFSNEMYKKLFNISDKKVTGAAVEDVFDKEKAENIRQKDKDVLESGNPIVFEESIDVNGETRHYKVNQFPLYGIPGMDGIVGGVATDITGEKDSRDIIEQQLKEKETLLMEIHHRVKNNLAVVSGMMQLQAFKETNEQVKEKLFDSTGRIKTMATIHELLYKSASFTDLKFDENIKKLITGITDTYHLSIDLDISYDLDTVELNINQAIPCSLIVNEVVTNVLKHAYEDGDSGNLAITLREKEDTIDLKIQDDGKGLPEDFDEEHKDSLGLELIDTLVSQLNAEYSYHPLDRGTEFRLAFDKASMRGSGSHINNETAG